MSIKILQEVNNRYHSAVALHRELADLFWLTYMPGYALWMEYQWLDEGLTQRKIKRFITSTYHVFMPDVLPESNSSITALTSGINRKKMDQAKSWETLQTAFNKYMKWEEETLNVYQECAAKLLESGEISSFNFLGEIIKEVKAELVYISDKIIELNSMDWDMTQIVAEQPNYYERYSHLISTIFSSKNNVSELHHWNSSLDSKTRVTESPI